MSERKSTVVTIDNGKFGKREIKYETGELAQQASGSATIYLNGETMLLNTVTASSKPAEGYDYFPLTVNVEERMYSVGKIPGSFFRREGKATTDATLASRLIDRPLRPLFIKGLKNEVQVVSTILSVSPDDSYDVVAINGCSMATMLSGIPFSGPVAGTRLALIDDQWVAFPTFEERDNAVFEMVVAGRITEKNDVAIAMIEAEATENSWVLIKNGATAPTEEVVAQGLEAAKPFIKKLCEGQLELAKIAAPPVKEYPVFPEYEDDVLEKVKEFASEKLSDALSYIS
jgi:polyribonucleotide nucleotidyltransferase